MILFIDTHNYLVDDQGGYVLDDQGNRIYVGDGVKVISSQPILIGYGP